jgi:hypothetical protein
MGYRYTVRLLVCGFPRPLRSERAYGVSEMDHTSVR